MKLLYYEAVSSAGDKISGVFEGTEEELVLSLRKKGAILLSVKESSKKKKRGKYTKNQLITDLEKLYYLIESGMKIDEAVKVAIKSSNKQKQEEFWKDVLSSLRQGNQFSASLKSAAQKHKVDIEELYVNILSVGEEVGDIKGALNRILEHMRFNQELSKEIRSALSYPLFLIGVSFIIILLTFGFIIPRFSSIFSEKELEKLPLISQLVLKTGVWINENFSLVITFITISALILLSLLTSLKKNMHEILSKIPIINNLVFSLDYSRLFTSLGIMLKGGVDIVKAVSLSKKVVKNKPIKNMLEEVKEELKKGQKLSHVFERYSIVPPEVSSLIAAGELSAATDDIFLNLGRKFLKEFERKVSSFLILLEPAVIIALGIFIGFIVVAIMLAVVSLTDVI